jgi:hypothetical protein
MYNMMDSNSVALASVYFCLFSLIGGVFLLNVILAIIMNAFDEEDKKDKEIKSKKMLSERVK